MYSRIAQIFSSRWLINDEAKFSYLPVLLSFLQGNDSAAIQLFKDDELKNKPFVVKGECCDIETCDRYDLAWDSENIQPNSVAVIPMQDVMDGEKNMRLAQYLQMADETQNVIAKLILANTPGGAVFYTDLCAKQIKDSKKPTLTHVMQMCASAGMWVASGSKQISASSPIDRLGSIGVMTDIMDLSGLLKDKLGIDSYQVYADKSTRKNEEQRAFSDKTKTIEERTALIKDNLNFVNELFHKSIMENLGISKDSEVLTGAMYFAQEAIVKKLCNKICTINEALNDAYNYGLANQLSSLNYKFNK